MLRILTGVKRPGIRDNGRVNDTVYVILSISEGSLLDSMTNTADYDLKQIPGDGCQQGFFPFLLYYARSQGQNDIQY